MRLVGHAHQRRAGIAVGDALGRAAEIDVDDVGAGVLGDLGAALPSTRPRSRRAAPCAAGRPDVAELAHHVVVAGGSARRWRSSRRRPGRRRTRSASSRIGRSVMPAIGARNARLRHRLAADAQAAGRITHECPRFTSFARIARTIVKTAAGRNQSIAPRPMRLAALAACRRPLDQRIRQSGVRVPLACAKNHRRHRRRRRHGRARQRRRRRRPKQYRMLAGKPVLARTIEAFLDVADVDLGAAGDPPRACRALCGAWA